MSHALPRNTFVVQSKALEAAGISIALVTRIPAPLKSIAVQGCRCAGCDRSRSRSTASFQNPRPAMLLLID